MWDRAFGVRAFGSDVSDWSDTSDGALGDGEG